MKATRYVPALLIGLAAWLPVQSAQACEFTRTPWGLRVSNCKLYDLTHGRYDLSIDTDRPHVPFPNLVVTDVDAAIIGPSANLSVQLANIGERNAGVFDVLVIATVSDPLRSGAIVGTTTLPPVTVPGLAFGAGATAYPGAVSLPNRNQDWDICTVAIVDPPATGRPAWGSVYESSEIDNQWPAPQQQGCCRAFGPKPDLNGPPACL